MNPFCNRQKVSDVDVGLQRRRFLYSPPIDLHAVKGVKNLLSNRYFLNPKTEDLEPVDSANNTLDRFRVATYGK